jgi:hypothetical protein
MVVFYLFGVFSYLCLDRDMVIVLFSGLSVFTIFDSMDVIGQMLVFYLFGCILSKDVIHWDCTH